VIFVLDFRFRQRGSTVDAPVDRLLALVDDAALDELSQGAHDICLVTEVHRSVRTTPLAEHRETTKLIRHDADEPFGRRAAGAADVGHRHVALLRPELAVDLELDRQSMTVVARHVRRIEAGHRP
jgi:hypothetical protein